MTDTKQYEALVDNFIRMAGITKDQAWQCASIVLQSLASTSTQPIDEENRRLRQIVSACVKALGTTAGASPDCSLSFMESVSLEVIGESCFDRLAIAHFAFHVCS